MSINTAIGSVRGGCTGLVVSQFAAQTNMGEWMQFVVTICAVIAISLIGNN